MLGLTVKRRPRRVLLVSLLAVGAGAFALWTSPAWADSAYVTNLGGANVSQYEIAAGGSLVAKSPATVATGSSQSAPEGVALSPDGKSVYVVNKGDNTLSQYDVGPGGALTPKATPTIATGNTPIGIAVSPDGRSAYVTNLLDSTLSEYDIAADGTLSLKQQATIGTGNAPEYVAVTPSGRNVYVTNFNGGVSQYDVGAGGTLTQKTPASVPAGHGALAIAVTPDGTSLYVTNATDNTISEFDIGPGGALTPKPSPTVGTGTDPGGITVSPDGTSGYVTNFKDATVSQYDIGPGGALVHKSPSAVNTGPSPVGIAITADGHSVYVASGGSNTISQYDVDAGGALTPKATPTVSGGSSPESIAVLTSPASGGGGGGSGGGPAGSGGAPGGHTPPVARFTVPGPSSTLKHGVWLNGALSRAPAGSTIVNYAWDTTGTGTYNWDCGRSPILSTTFLHPGDHTVGLKVTDAAGGVGFVTEHVTVSQKLLAGVRQSTPVFDCENPAAGNQPDRADCVKSFGYGIIDANSRGRPEDCFQITTSLNQTALQYHPQSVAGLLARDGATRSATAAFTKLPFVVYHATLKGPVAINGLYFPLPESNQSEYNTDDLSFTLGHVSIDIGKFRTPTVDIGHVVALPNSQGIVHLSDPVLQGANAALGALPIKGAISVDLVYHASRVRFHLTLPPPFSFDPTTSAQGDVYLTSDNENGIKFDGARLGPLDTWLGPVFVKHLTFRFLQSQNLWEGGADLFVPGSPVGLNAAQPPPDAGFGLKNGRFDHAGVGLDFVPPAQPELFPGVFLTNIHVAIGTHPLRFTGGGAISAGDVVDINGDLFVAFAAPDRTYVFPTDAATGDLAPLAGRTLDSLTIALGGDASLHVPFFGDIGLGHAHVLYEYPDFVEVGADYGLDLGLVKFGGTLDGFVLPSAHKFSFSSQVSACPNFKVKLPVVGTVTIDKPCFGAGVAISTVGVGVCGTVPIPFFTGTVPVTITVGYKWGGSIGLALFTCDLGPYQEANPRAAAASTPYPLTLPRGLPSAMIRVVGRGGPPDVTINTPSHRAISTASPPNDPNVIVLTVGDTTLIALKHPAGGLWKVTPDASSVPVTSVASANGLPAPRITVRVTGAGHSRALTYTLNREQGQTITFAEHGARTYRVIGAAKGARGTIRFTPASGRAGSRQILALITDAGVQMRTLVVGHYSAPRATRLAAPARLRAVHRGSSLTVTWARERGATSYTMIIATSDGTRTLRLTRAYSVQLGGVPPRVHGTVSVEALGAGAIPGQPARTAFGGQ